MKSSETCVPCLTEDPDTVILQAIAILRLRFEQRDAFSSPDAVKDYLRLQAQGLEHEVFAVMYLNAQNRLIAYERVSAGR